MQSATTSVLICICLGNKKQMQESTVMLRLFALLSVAWAGTMIIGRSFTMTILDEKEPTISLKLVIAVISVIAFGAFGSCLMVSGAHPPTATTDHAQVPAPRTL
jgi:hypothetical protein